MVRVQRFAERHPSVFVTFDKCITKPPKVIMGVAVAKHPREAVKRLNNPVTNTLGNHGLLTRPKQIYLKRRPERAMYPKALAILEGFFRNLRETGQAQFPGTNGLLKAH